MTYPAGMNEERLDWLGSPCWFCGTASPVEGASSVVQVHKMVAPGEILHTTVSVPRCETCRAGHFRVNTLAFGIAFCGAGLVTAITLLWDPFDFPIWGDVLAVMLAMGPGGMMLGQSVGLPAGIRPERTGATFRAVLEMLKNGWYLDDAEMNEAAREAIRIEIEGKNAS